MRLTAVRLSRLELTLAGHGGGELRRRYFAIEGEVGASLFLERGHTRVAPHTGVLLESVIFNLYLRQDWLELEPSYAVGGGGRYQPTFGSLGLCEV